MSERMKTTAYSTQKEVSIKTFTAKPVMIDAGNVTAVDGLKIVKAGTGIGHATLNIMEDPDALGSPLNTTRTQVYTINDVDVTDGNRTVACMTNGVLDLDKVNDVQVVSADAKAAVAGRISFEKR